MADISLIDTTLRDGQQSLWAMGMRTEYMLPVVAEMNDAGFDCAEFWAPGVHIYKMAREIGQNPWHWLSKGAPLAKKVKLRLHGGWDTGFGKVPRSVVTLLLEHVRAFGIDSTRRSNWWNDYAVLAPQFEYLENLGFKCIANLVYSVSPRHTDEYYEERASEAAALNPYRICLKDVGGLLTPERTRTLVPKILAKIGHIPLELHAHSGNGLAPLCYLEAADAGVRYLHTAIPPLANGSSNPSVFTVARNLQERGHEVSLNEGSIQRIARHFDWVADREGFPKGAQPEYDERLYKHQIPGGMISNLEHQLAEVGAGDRLDEALEETARVREEFGHPIMVTPLAQFVGTQAAINVITGERYKVVTDSTIEYALGRWGRQAVELMNPEVKDVVLSSPRAEELSSRPPDVDETPLDEVRSRFGSEISDDELIVRCYAGDYAERALSAPEPPRIELGGRNALRELLLGIAANDGIGDVTIKKGQVSLRVAKSNSRTRRDGTAGRISASQE